LGVGNRRSFVHQEYEYLSFYEEQIGLLESFSSVQASEVRISFEAQRVMPS